MNTETSIYEFAKQGLAISRGKPALWFFGNKISYQALFEKIDGVARNLYREGIRKGTVVTIHLTNCPQAVIAVYAVAKLGGICNMVHPLTPAAALRENMAFTKSKWLITASRDCGDFGGNIFFVDISHYMGPAARTVWRLKNGTDGEKHRSFEKLLERSPSEVPVSEGRDGSEPAVYLHSSGTTETPKTIVLSHSALNHCVANTADFFEEHDMAKQVCLAVLPLFHGFGLAMDVHRSVSFGSQLVLLPRWNAAAAVKLIKKHGVTLMVGVPAMYSALLKEKGFRGKRIRQLSKCYVGGDMVKPELVAEFDERLGGGHRMFAGFGLTEATTTNCVNTYRHYKTGSIGYPVRNTTVAVLNEAGCLSGTGEGELVICSRSLMLGYLEDPRATEKTLFYADGKKWTRTGDRVRIDEDGFVFYISRIKNIIIRNGYNIYPHQIETVICGVEGVLDVCVVGVEEPERSTQLVRAVVIACEGVQKEPLEERIRKRCAEALPRYALPAQVAFVSAFPRNAMGKIDRKELSKL